MANNLAFSIDNILRSDFPHPSRINKLPRVLYPLPLEGREKVPFVALRCQVDCRMNHGETRLLGRQNYVHQLPTFVVCPDVQPSNSISSSKDKERSGLVDGNSSELQERNARNEKKDENKEEDKAKGDKSTVKKKRNRSHFSQMQLKYLEDVFSRQQYLTRDERSLLANALDMTELQIRNWFQNRRYQLRHRGINRPRQVPVKVLVSNDDCKDSHG